MLLGIEPQVVIKRLLPIVFFALFWVWETWAPFFGQRHGRGRHALRNLAIALTNTAVIGVVFGTVTVVVAQWAKRNRYGLLHTVEFTAPIHFLLAFFLLDGWMYLWHRANHRIPWLWRFHRMHHTDRQVDVTTATRFHLGEQIGSALLRIALIPLLGFEIWDFVVYDALVLVVTQFHHADISIGWADPWLRAIVVTPFMHKVHHSDWQPETDSNYSTVLSLWDRLAGTFRMRAEWTTLNFGLEQFDEPTWQTFGGMLKTPFVTDRPSTSGSDGDARP